MNGQNMGSAAIKEAITATVLIIIAAVIAGIMPLLGFFIYFAAIPFFTVTRKYGFIFVLPFAFMAYFMVGVYSGFIGAIFDILGSVMPALVMGELSRINRKQPEVLGKGIITSVLFSISAFAAQYFISGKPMVEEMRVMIIEPINKAVASGDLTMHSAQLAKDSYEMMIKAVPSIVFVWSVVIVLLIYYIGCHSLVKRGMEIENYSLFRFFSFSKNLIKGCVFIGILAFLVTTLNLVDGQALYMNLMILVWFLFALQGIAVLTFFFQKMRVPRAFFVLTLFILFISVFGTIILFVLGFVDLLMNFRAKSLEDKG